MSFSVSESLYSEPSISLSSELSSDSISVFTSSLLMSSGIISSNSSGRKEPLYHLISRIPEPLLIHPLLSALRRSGCWNYDLLLIIVWKLALFMWSKRTFLHGGSWKSLDQLYLKVRFFCWWNSVSLCQISICLHFYLKAYHITGTQKPLNLEYHFKVDFMLFQNMRTALLNCHQPAEVSVLWRFLFLRNSLSHHFLWRHADPTKHL